MKKYLPIIVLLVSSVVASCHHTTRNLDSSAALSSPDGALTLTAETKEGELLYALKKGDQTVLEPSHLGLILREIDLDGGLTLLGSDTGSFDETWQEPWGEEETVRNRYNELRLHLKKDETLLDVVFRLFDDGLGFRYEFPEGGSLDSLAILDERTQFAFPNDPVAYAMPKERFFYYEDYYEKSLLSAKDTIAAPVTMKVSDNLYLSVYQANLTDYASMNLFTRKDAPAGKPVLEVDLVPWSTGEKVFGKTPFVSPWRTVIVAEKTGDLALSRLMLNLNEPSKIEDTSWIEPGRYIGIWWEIHHDLSTWHSGPKHAATTENAKKYIDFAAKHGFSGVLVEGWNKGWDGDWTDSVDMFSFTESYPDYDLREVQDYALSKGTRIIAHAETGGMASHFEEQMEEAFKLYQSIGINTVKTGYVFPKMDRKEHQHSQYGIRHYQGVIETAARYHIMIDNHEPAMPSGIRRTWPNLMTGEAVRGMEWNAFDTEGGNCPEHTVILPFTRGLAGPMDYTPTVFNFDNDRVKGTRPQTTRAKQLALFVILYSPLQMAADMPWNYEGRPEFDFVTSCPTNWSKTLFPAAELGEYVVTARKERGGERWFLGAATNADARDVTISLDFLTPGVRYKAVLFEDGEGADYRTNPYPVSISEKEVDSKTVLALHLATSGGAAIRFEPL